MTQKQIIEALMAEEWVHYWHHDCVTGERTLVSAELYVFGYALTIEREGKRWLWDYSSNSGCERFALTLRNAQRAAIRGLARQLQRELRDLGLAS